MKMDNFKFSATALTERSAFETERAIEIVISPIDNKGRIKSR